MTRGQYIRTSDVKEKNSKSRKGKGIGICGKYERTIEIRDKQSNSMKSHSQVSEFKIPEIETESTNIKEFNRSEWMKLHNPMHNPETAKKCKGFKDKHHTNYSKELLRQAHLGKSLSEEHKDSIRKSMEYLKGIPRSPEVCKKIGDAQRGELNQNFGKIGEESTNWKGGITPLVVLIRSSIKYSLWRISVFKRDSYLCQDCKDSLKTYLHVHHKKRIVEIIRENNITSLDQALLCEPLWDLSNGITLCEECHNKTIGYKNNNSSSYLTTYNNP